MKKLFIGLITFLLIVGVASAETEKRVDGQRVETYKRVTVDTIRGDATNGIYYDTNRDGTNDITMQAAGNLVITDGTVNADYAEGTAAVDETRYYDHLVTMTADPAASAGVSGGYFRVNKTAGSNGVYTLNGLEGVVGSSYADEAGTFRGVYGRTYTNADATSTMRTAVAGEFSPRASYSGGTECVAEAGTAFVGVRVWMAPYFTAASVDNLNNFWGLWIYGEHATQRNGDAAIKISDAGGGFTDDIILQSGDKITNTAAGTVTFSGGIQSGIAGADGKLTLYSEQGTTDYTVSLNPNAAMTSNALFYMPADEPGADTLLCSGTDGVIDYVVTSAAFLASCSDETGTGVLVFNDSPTFVDNIIFEGTADEYETTIGVIDPTTIDKTINFPDASGTVAVSASAPATLSVTGDIGVTVLKDITVSGTGMSGGANDVLPGADADVNIALETSKDIVASGTGMSGGADDVLPGADADVTITLTTLKDIVAGAGLSGGENDVLPGADADTTISLDLGYAATWTSIHNFQAATTAIILGKDDATNVAGALKLWGSGATNFYTTITAGANSANADFILPTALPAATYLVTCTSGGQLGYDSSAYLTGVTADAPLSGAGTSASHLVIDISKDLVAGTGLTGGANDVFPGADSDVTVSLDQAVVPTWTGAHSFQSAVPQITLGKDEASVTPNIVGQIKMFSAGDNAYYSTLTAGTNTSNAAFILPVDEPAGTYLLNMTVGGQIGYDSSVYLTAEVDGSITNELPLAGNLIDISGAGSNVVDVDLTEAEAVTWGGGAQATIVHTFNVSGTDVTMTYGSAALGIVGVVTTDGLTLGQDENITLGAQTLDHDGTDFIFSDSVNTGANVIKTTANIAGMPHKWSASLLSPNAAYTAGNTVIPIGTATAALTVTRVVCTTSSASYEVAGDVKYADTRISLGTATVINDFDTTSGVRDDSSITSGAVASGKFVYLIMDAAPNAAMTDFTVEVYWDFD